MRALAIALILGAAPAAAEDTFAPLFEVMTSPRCLNCHQPERPLQGDGGHVHRLNVARGPDGTGAAAMPCSACHGAANNPSSSVPGAPGWALAPVEMDWTGLDAAALCRAVTDPVRNGGRDPAALGAHMTVDPLVQWGWTPGTHADGTARTTPPLPQAGFHQAVRTWLDAGAPCPG